MRIRRLLPLAFVATALLATACGTPESASDEAQSASPLSASASASASPSATPTTTPTPTGKSKPKPQPEPSRPPGSEKPVRALVSVGGAAKGPLDKVATPITDAAALEKYAATLAPSLQRKFTTEATRQLQRVPAGQVLYAQTVHDGCEKFDTSAIKARTQGDDVVLSVTPSTTTTIQCLVAERTVALLSR